MIAANNVTRRIATFQRNKKPTIGCSPGFLKTSGMLPVRVPDGQIYLQKAGPPCPTMSTTNRGIRITKTNRMMYLRYRSIRSPGKRLPKGTQPAADKPPHQSANHHQKTTHIKADAELPAPHDCLQRTNRTGPHRTGAGIAIQSGKTDMLQRTRVNFSFCKADGVAVGQKCPRSLDEDA